MKYALFASLAISSATLLAATETEFYPRIIPEGYSVKTIATPVDENGEDLLFGVGGIGFLSDGSAMIASRNNGIWKYQDEKWHRFSEHLHDPQGIHVVDNSSVIVAQKPELTLIKDSDGDGVADLYQTLCDDWRYIGDYCEYIHGPVVDSEGNYYLNINLANGPDDMMMRQNTWMGSAGGYDGWNVKISPDGKMTPFASGLRSPAGIGIDKVSDEIWYTENQGGWVAASFLAHIEEGKFYGHPSTLLDHPDFRGQPEKIQIENFEHMRKLPSVYLPHGELNNSPGNPEFNYTKGKFGPFENQIFIGCQARSNITRVSLQKVNGEYQGAAFNFIDHLQSGAIRLSFDDSGSLWVGQTGRGWRSRGGKLYGLQRVEWDGETVPFEMKDIKLTATGFKVEFTSPGNLDTLSNDDIKVSHWGYNYSDAYGSPKVDEQKEKAVITQKSDYGLSFEFDVPLQKDRVYRITIDSESVAGKRPSVVSAYYTLNHLIE
ncbi:DUF7133 domain-containing protein [Pelagicoccus mobilis]|uniref:PQQ-dependent sugar dehydrogenase n=1 Tax=Pelagicoccus mobilis TaxID=415221 RepID=A0A934RPW9_9BACT|nr:PQQ-dependent sugar dehydrogenase [Pelagicoccus mobilis]MBK1875305.1 PQQ-dependent sugar dehydrogenase [Pelagicoccus mobilis]